ncbi:MAG: alpha/beta hydrolase [Spirochaetales bacterium]|nr:alpha/beta hydrolase [Spirochaetales bacterium]
MSKTKKARLGQITMEYTLSGDSNQSVLFFVHSEGLSLEEFSEQHDFFKGRYRVLSASLRGHGNTLSDQELGETDYDLALMADDLIKLLNFLDIKSAHYIGHGLGGILGFELLKLHEKRLKSLITFGSYAYRKNTSLTKALRKFTYGMLNPKGISNLRSSRGLTPEAKIRIQKLISPTAKECFINLNNYLTHYDYLSTIKQSKIPAMILRGSFDQKHPKSIRKTVEAFQSRGNFLLVHLNNAGFFINIDQAERFNQELEKGLAILSANQVSHPEARAVLV